MRRDALGTLREVARAGYRAVELVGYGNADVGSIGELLSELEVSMLGAHISYEDLDADLDTAIGDLIALDADYLVVQQARPQDWSTVDSVKRLAATLNEWGAASLERGLSLGYHGYHPIEAEFALLPTGVAAYDLMVAETDPSLVTIQVGRDTSQALASQPCTALRRCGIRTPSSSTSRAPDRCSTWGPTTSTCSCHSSDPWRACGPARPREW
jgi:hypothetical protein